jgi:xanthine/uracil/vitamin C permease (AzgA family)|tara:strand:+ start:947 stop:1156 length:210 start_codon:yes stop_codon:yes gene_type:complete
MSKKLGLGFLLVYIGFVFVFANFSLDVRYWLPVFAVGTVLIAIGGLLLQNQLDEIKGIKQVKVLVKTKN